jgi:monoamine oxidase
MSFISRRKLLKKAVSFSALASTSTLTSACASLDAIVMGEKNKGPLPVAIIGGGLAGLTASYYLRKNNIKFTCFEASPRWGGRIFTLNPFNSTSQVAELGGEWISSTHQPLLQLCRDLRITLDERNYSGQPIATSFERSTSEAEFLRLLQRFQKVCARKRNELFTGGLNRLTVWNVEDLVGAKNQDLLSCQDWVESLLQFKELSPFLKNLVQSHWGADWKNVSSLHLIYLFAENKDFFAFANDKQYRISGGSSVLTQSLYNRVAGVLPERFFKKQHELINIRYQDSLFELTFSTPQGQKEVSAEKVIISLPPHLLSQVKGIDTLNIPNSISELKMGALVKGAVSYSERPWKKMERYRWNLISQNALVWETEPRSFAASFAQKSILALQWGGEIAQKSDSMLVENFIKNPIANQEGTWQAYSWQTNPWSRGGRPYFQPGQTSQMAGLFLEPFMNQQLYFIGDYAHVEFNGTMNGAVETAQVAVSKIMRRLKVSSAIDFESFI